MVVILVTPVQEVERVVLRVVSLSEIFSLYFQSRVRKRCLNKISLSR